MTLSIKLIHTFFIATICAIILTGCNDDKLQPSTVDEKQWEFNKNKDTSYAPGDNFYMYCIGKWWNETDLENLNETGFLSTEVFQAMQERYDNIDNQSFNNFYYQGETFLSELMKELDIDINYVYILPETADYINTTIADTWTSTYKGKSSEKHYIYQAIT